MGGYAAPGTNHVEVLSLETWKWTDFTPMNNDRRDFSMTVLDGYLAAFGGKSIKYIRYLSYNSYNNIICISDYS